jgi:hypothetical protein
MTFAQLEPKEQESSVKGMQFGSINDVTTVEAIGKKPGRHI